MNLTEAAGSSIWIGEKAPKIPTSKASLPKKLALTCSSQSAKGASKSFYKLTAITSPKRNQNEQ